MVVSPPGTAYAKKEQAGQTMNARLFGAALAGTMVPAAEPHLLIADTNPLRLTPSLGSRGG
jgi:hypothetical protein